MIAVIAAAIAAISAAWRTPPLPRWPVRSPILRSPAAKIGGVASRNANFAVSE